jgi:hypothetical protein
LADSDKCADLVGDGLGFSPIETAIGLRLTGIGDGPLAGKSRTRKPMAASSSSEQNMNDMHANIHTSAGHSNQCFAKTYQWL